MTFDAAKLFRDFGDQAFVFPSNSGNARRGPARRGRDTFVPYRVWREFGWTPGQLTGHQRSSCSDAMSLRRNLT